MDRESAQNWLNRYIDAWLSYDPDEVAALFSEDVVYRYHPYDEPIVGREAVVASWLGEGASEDASTRDVPGTYEAEYSPVAIDGDAAVATGNVAVPRSAWRACRPHLRKLLRHAVRRRRTLPRLH